MTRGTAWTWLQYKYCIQMAYLSKLLWGSNGGGERRLQVPLLWDEWNQNVSNLKGRLKNMVEFIYPIIKTIRKTMDNTIPSFKSFTIHRSVSSGNPDASCRRKNWFWSQSSNDGKRSFLDPVMPPSHGVASWAASDLASRRGNMDAWHVRKKPFLVCWLVLGFW